MREITQRRIGLIFLLISSLAVYMALPLFMPLDLAVGFSSVFGFAMGALILLRW